MGGSPKARPGVGAGGLARRIYYTLLLVSIDTIGPFSSDAYLPNIVQIEKEFRTSTMMVALTLQLNWIATAFASTAVGVLADRCGRRPVLAACFAVYVASAALAAAAPSVEVLIVARVLMGLGQSSQVMAQVIARDLVDDARTRLRVMAVLSSLQPIVIVAAPVVGGTIGGSLGWRWVFGLQAGWGALAGLGSLAMREPRAADVAQERATAETEALCLSSLCATACRLLKSRMYVGALGLFGIMFSAIAAMLTLLPLAMQGYYGLGEAATGGVMGAAPLFIMAGGGMSLLLSRCLPPVAILRLVMFPFLALAASTAFLAVFYAESPSLGVPATAWWPLLLPCFLMTAVNGVFMPVCQTLYLNAFKDIAGAAAGASGLVQSLMMALGSAVASALWDGTPRSFYATLAGLMLAAQLWFWLTLGLCRPPPEVKKELQQEQSQAHTASGGVPGEGVAVEQTSRSGSQDNPEEVDVQVGSAGGVSHDVGSAERDD